MPMNLDVLHLCYYFLSVCIAFIVKGLAGFGDPLVSTPMLSVFLPNSIITPGLSPVSPILNAKMVWENRAHFSARVVLPISVFVLLGVIPGTLLLKFGSPAPLKVLLGFLIIGLGIEMLTRKAVPSGTQNPIIRSIVSFGSGFTAGLFGINLFFLAYLERVSVRREEFRANVCFVFFLENIFRIVVYLYQGLFTCESLLLSAIALPAAVLGMKLGGAADRRMSDKVSRKCIIYVFILGGISTVLYALPQCL